MNIKYYRNLFIISFSFGLLIHGFCFFNLVLNLDGITQFPSGYGTGIESGRWLLEVMGKIAKKYLIVGSFNIPSFNGILSLAILCITYCFLESTFCRHSLFWSALGAFLFVSYPSYSALLLYSFTSVYYVIAVFLAVLPMVIIQKRRNWLTFSVSAFSICCSLGIYQAYIPLTITLFLLFMIRRASEEGFSSWISLFKTGFFLVGILVAGYIGYRFFLSFFLDFFKASLSDYQGINEMGNYTISSLFGAVITSYKMFFESFTSGYYLDYGIPLIRISFVVFAAFTLCLLLITFFKIKSRINKFVFIIASCLLPLGGFFIHVMCEQATFLHVLMVYGPCILFFLWHYLSASEKVKDFCLVSFLENFSLEKTKQNIREICGAGFSFISQCCIIVSFCWLACYNYQSCYFTCQQESIRATALAARIETIEGFDESMPVLFFGDKTTVVNNTTYPKFGAYTFTVANPSSFFASYAFEEYLSEYLGYPLLYAGEDIERKIVSKTEFKEMPTYPNHDSIRIIDGVIVVKFSAPDER